MGIELRYTTLNLFEVTPVKTLVAHHTFLLSYKHFHVLKRWISCRYLLGLCVFRNVVTHQTDVRKHYITKFVYTSHQWNVHPLRAVRINSLGPGDGWQEAKRCFRKSGWRMGLAGKRLECSALRNSGSLATSNYFPLNISDNILPL